MLLEKRKVFSFEDDYKKMVDGWPPSFSYPSSSSVLKDPLINWDPDKAERVIKSYSDGTDFPQISSNCSQVNVVKQHSARHCVWNPQLTLTLTIPRLMGGWEAFYWQSSLPCLLSNLFSSGPFTQENQYSRTLPSTLLQAFPSMKGNDCIYSLVSWKPETHQYDLRQVLHVLSMSCLQGTQVTVSRGWLAIWEQGVLRRKTQRDDSWTSTY